MRYVLGDPPRTSSEAFDALDATLTAKVAQSIREKEANLPQKPPEPPQTASTAFVAPEGPTGFQESDIVQMTFEARADGKYQLDLYPQIGDEVGKYPEVKYVADRERMWHMISGVMGDTEIKLPMKKDVSWVAVWKQGKATGKTKKDGTPGYYKDLEALREK